MKRITAERTAQLRHVSTIERKMKPQIARFLNKLQDLMNREEWLEAFRNGDIPSDVVEKNRERLEQLRQEVVYAMSNPEHRLVEQVDPNELARMQIGELVQGLEAKQLAALRRQLALLYELGPTPAVLELVGRITGLTERQIEQVARARQVSLEAGATPQQASRVAATAASRARAYRATLIARTEAVRHAGNIIQARGAELAAQGKTVKRLWLSSRDEYVCPICIRNDTGEWIGLHEPFPSGHSTPPAHPGCRCVLELYVGDEEPRLMNFERGLR